MCTYNWWPILYTYLFLLTYSVHMELIDELFSTQTTTFWPIHYKYPTFGYMDLPLVTYSVYVPRFGELFRI